MLQRVLAVSFAQVLRSISLVLLPIAFISLIAWATAGSTSGNTSDPIRAAIWLWLGAHHIPFFVTGVANGYLSYLPIGAMFLPFFALRYGFSIAFSKLHGDFHNLNSVRTIFSLQYALLLTLFAFLSKTETVSSQWYLAPIFAFFISYLSTLTVGTRQRLSKAASYASRVISILLGSAFIFLAYLLFTNLNLFKNITIVLEPGILGSLLLFFLNLLYLPNAAIAVLAYFTGTGFAVGAGTLVSPLIYRLGDIPALPLLAILPTSTSKLALTAIALVVIVGGLLAAWALSSTNSALLQALFLILITISAPGYLASGSLLTPAMGSVGVSIWRLALSVILQLGIGVGAMVLLPQIRLRSRR
jgi:hypothetical protein